MGRLGRFKADTVNRIVAEHQIRTAVELGCGDGQQLALLKIEDYVGVDISPTVVEMCRRTLKGVPGRRFIVEGEQSIPAAEMSLSMDVLLHLVEDSVFEAHLRSLFGLAERLVVIYSTDHDRRRGLWPHNRHRKFTPWVDRTFPEWRLHEVVDPPWPTTLETDDETSDAQFHVYVRS